LVTLSGLDDSRLDSLAKAFQNAASTGNPLLIKAALQSQKAAQNVALAKRAYAPSLSASLSTGLSYTNSAGLSVSSGRLSLSASIPLDFWVSAAGVKKQEIAQSDALLSQAESQADTGFAIQQAAITLVNQAGSVLSASRSSDYARQNAQFVGERYRLLQSSVSDLSSANALEQSAQTSLIKARYGFLSALRTLKGLGGLEEDSDVIKLIEGSV
jgi:outer membrane protein TolC